MVKGLAHQVIGHLRQSRLSICHRNIYVDEEVYFKGGDFSKMFDFDFEAFRLRGIRMEQYPAVADPECTFNSYAVTIQ